MEGISLLPLLKGELVKQTKPTIVEHEGNKMPVSYTHLDVYKRQVMKYPGSLSYIPTEKDNKDTEDKVMKKRCVYN